MAQSPIGGWRYNPGDLGDTSVLGWQMFALRSAHLAGLKVPDNAIQGAVAYLNRASADMGGTTYCYMPGGRVSSVMTAEALLIRMYVGWTPKMTSMRKGIALVSADLRKFQDRNIYYWYYATQLLHNIHGSEWKRWNARVRDELIRTQVTDKSCADGSWDPAVPTPDRWGNSAGRHYQTTMSILTLEVYYRYLPLYGTADLQDGGLVEAVPGTGTNRTGRAQAAAAGKAKAKSGEARKTQ